MAFEATFPSPGCTSEAILFYKTMQLRLHDTPLFYLGFVMAFWFIWSQTLVMAFYDILF